RGGRLGGGRRCQGDLRGRLGRFLGRFRRLAVGDALLELGLDRREHDLQRAAARFLPRIGGLQRRQRVGWWLGGRRGGWALARRQCHVGLGGQQVAQQPGARQQQEYQGQGQQEGAGPWDDGGPADGSHQRKRRRLENRQPLRRPRQ